MHPKRNALAALFAALVFTLTFTDGARAATLDEAVASVQRMADSKPGPTRDYQLGWALMDYVHSNVSPVRYSRMIQRGEKLPVTVDEILATHAGICGSQIMTALAIADRVGLKVRAAQFYGASHGQRWSHIAIEVWANHGWRFFDVTWNTVYRVRPGSRTLMSITGLRRLPVDQRLRHQDVIGVDHWRDQYPEPFIYVTGDLDMTLGGSGTFRLPHATPRRFRVGPNVLNYIGFQPTYAAPAGGTVKMRLDGLARPTVTLTVVVGDAANLITARSRIVSSHALAPGQQTVTLPVRGSSAVFSVTDGAATLERVVN